MPRGPKGERRPADVIDNAVKFMRIAVGEEEEDHPRDPVQLGKLIEDILTGQVEDRAPTPEAARD